MNRGFTLIETIIAVGIFSIISLGIYFSYSNLLDSILIDKTRSSAVAVLENEIETVRNVPYPDVGIQSGVPPGNLSAEKLVSYGGAEFNIKTYVKNIDDPSDGTLGGNPADLIPADYKLVQLEASCHYNCTMAPMTMTITVAPKNLEKATKNGALFINVFDASGTFISGANVNITNNYIIPKININETTDINGNLNFVDIATSSAGYHIVVTKAGYSTDQTYPAGEASNPNPINLDVTVREQELTKVSFAIDKLSTIDLKTQDNMCKSVPNVDFHQQGNKLIGTNPDVYKFSADSQTDASGLKTINNLEWDTYDFSNIDSDYDLSGTNPLNPLVLNPQESVSMKWILQSKAPAGLLVTILDEDETPVDEASVMLSSGNFTATQYTNRSYFGQTNWSGGKFTSQTGKIETENPGELTIKSIDGKYATSSEELISSTFDLGAMDTVFYKLRWDPVSQPSETGLNSLKFQIATNNGNSTWNFVGPNGQSTSFYTVSDTSINPVHNGDRYLRYKVFMQTVDSQYTPKLKDLSIEFKSSCITLGQTFFTNLSVGDYLMTVKKPGYNDTEEEISITNNWQSFNTILYVP